jgi:hypothetical protein
VDVPLAEVSILEALERRACRHIFEEARFRLSKATFVGVVDGECYSFCSREVADSWSRNTQIDKSQSEKWEDNPFCGGFYFKMEEDTD